MWNDVNKVLPEKDGDYLVGSPLCKFPFVLTYSVEGKTFHDDYNNVYETVTCWQRLPELPKFDNIDLSDIDEIDIDFLNHQFKSLYLELGKILGIGSVITNPVFSQNICDSVYNVEGLFRDVERIFYEYLQKRQRCRKCDSET